LLQVAKRVTCHGSSFAAQSRPGCSVLLFYRRGVLQR
jgi:hypothetical protein